MEIRYDKIYINLKNYFNIDERIMILEKFGKEDKISFISQSEIILETSKSPQELKRLLILMFDFIKTILFVNDNVIETEEL